MEVSALRKELTPVKFNRGQLIHKYGNKPLIKSYKSFDYTAKSGYLSIHRNVQVKDVICVDWFETTVIIKLAHIDEYETSVKLSDSVYLMKTGERTKHYNHVWEVFFEGERIGTILTHPQQKFISEDYAQFKLDNFLLYSVDWLETYFNLMASANWIHKGLTRLDISIDGSSIKNALKLIYKHDNGNTVGRKGKAMFNFTKGSKKNIEHFHVGSASSDKVATIYKKSDEIKKSEKNYIKDFWFKNGLEDIEDVYRFELRLRSKVTKNYDINSLNDFNYLASIVRTEVKNWFEFYYVGKDTNKHRTYKNNKEMNWIDWESIQGELLPKHKAVATDSVYKAKRLIKDMFYFHYVENKPLQTAYIDRLISEFSLHHWYSSKQDYWKAEFDKMKRLNGFNSN